MTLFTRSWKGKLPSTPCFQIPSVLLALSEKHELMDEEETCPYSSEFQAPDNEVLDLHQAVERFHHILRVVRLLMNCQVCQKRIVPLTQSVCAGIVFRV